jgi:TATA-binding protein-associated factor
LHSRSFETRQAAASALSQISQAVGIWDPSITAPSSSDESSPAFSTEPVAGAFSLANFDVRTILKEGSLLLSSSGNEYAKLANLSAEELAQAQKDALGKLGLGMGAAGGGTEDELGLDMGAELAAGVQTTGGEPSTSGGLPPPKFKQESSPGSLPTILSRSISTAPTSVKVEESTPVVVEATTSTSDDPYEGLSARERNKMKRKRKTDAKSGSSTSNAFSAPAPKVRVVEAPAGKGKAVAITAVDSSDSPAVGLSGQAVVIDPGAKAREGGEVKVVEADGKDRADMEVKEGEWPWRGTVDRLTVGLLS